MIYPEVLTIKQLQSKDPDYNDRKSFLEEIETLFKGGRYIEAQKDRFLLKRLDEDLELYQLRLKRFVYTNILSHVISKVLGRFSTGDILVSNLSNSFIESWQSFRENIDVKGNDEKTFLSNVLKDLLLNQTAIVQIDKPKVEVTPLNRAQEVSLGLNKAFLVTYKPTELLNSGEGWYKFLVLNQVSTPFGETYTEAIWRFIDAEKIVEYKAFVILKDGQIKHLYDPRTSKIIPFTDDVEIPLYSEIAHGFSSVPVVKLHISDEQYAAGNAYLKLKQFLNVENSLTDTALSSGYVQRVLTPIERKDDDYSVVVDEVKSDNQHVITANSFKFEEIEGTSIATNMKLLEAIETQINNLVCIAAGDTSRSALVRAAASKKMDASDFELFLISYGSLITKFYQNILTKVAEALGDRQAVSQVSVSGLNQFDTDDLETDVAIANSIIPIADNLSPTALRFFYERISLSLNKTATADMRSTIQQEILMSSPVV
jgi:hypothetical protein